MTTTESLLRRDRLIVLGGLAAICLLSWYYLLSGAGTGMDTLAMSQWRLSPGGAAAGGVAWSLQYAVLMLVMWWVMMIAMMLPGAAPIILLYARVQRYNDRLAGNMDAAVPTATFVAGYLATWFLFSALATTLQWLLQQWGLVHAMMMWSSDRTLSGLFLLAAGGYQFSALKSSCLDHCRNPAGFLSRHWRNGHLGALCLGWLHGIYCVGCCWMLMLLLFVGGVMNLVWIAGLSLLVLLEKLLSPGLWLPRASGFVLLAAGTWLLL